MLKKDNNKITFNVSANKFDVSNMADILSKIPQEQQNELEKLITDLEKSSLQVTYSETKLPVKAVVRSKLSLVAPKHDYDSDFVLHEIGVFWGIIIGRTTRKTVESNFKNYEDCLVVNNNINMYSRLYFYRNLDIAICFDNNDVVREITLGKEFRGKTAKGLRIGDSLEAALKIYGKPDKTLLSNVVTFYTWEELTVFFENGVVTHIRYKQ